MLVRIHGMSIERMEKAEVPAGVVRVKIIANHLTEDIDGETVLKQAFDEQTVKNFLNIGIIDWWHKSKDPDLSDNERARAVLGRPVDFLWENGKPVVIADLTKSHPVVAEMMPHLEAKQPVFAGSIGGAKVVFKVTDKNGQKKRIIPKINFDHLAIAPCNSVVNREPGMNVELLQKAGNQKGDLMVEFGDMMDFCSHGFHIDDEILLRKAIEAPESVADLSNTSGGVLTKQSLEKTVSNLTLSDDDGLSLIDVVIKIANGSLPANEKAVKSYFDLINKADTGSKVVSLINKYFEAEV
jgi:hypothetical protein